MASNIGLDQEYQKGSEGKSKRKRQKHRSVWVLWPRVLLKPYETMYHLQKNKRLHAFTMGSTQQKTRATKDPEGTTTEKGTESKPV